MLQSEQVAILMPVKNVATWIKECIDSILNQSYPHFALYIVNDHSADSTSEILKNYTALDDRIKVWDNKGNGIIDALSLAYSKSSELLITRMDGDDVMPKNKLEILVNSYRKNPNTVVSGKVKYFGKQPISKGYLAYESWLNERIAKRDFNEWQYRECVIASANWLTSRHQIDTIGGFKSLSYPEDYDMVLKWITNEVPITGIDAVTHLWREHPERTSRNNIHYQQAAFFKLKIEHWTQHSYYKSVPLYLIGKGKKQQLVSDILRRNSINHVVLDQQDYSEFELTHILKTQLKSQLLICVYPPKKPRVRLESWLKSCGYSFGKNCWYV